MVVYYSLSTTVFKSPIPFPESPSYLVINQTPSTFYFNHLYSPSTSPSNLLDFTTLILSTTSRNPSSLRQLLLPIHSFDHKYSSLVPSIVISSTSTSTTLDEPPPLDPDFDSNNSIITQEEQEQLLKAYRDWKLSSSYEEKKSVLIRHKQKEGVQHQSQQQQEEVEEDITPNHWTIERETALDWINQLELVDTLLQCLVLLTIISLPSPSEPTTKLKKKKNKVNPERQSETLDPELLLDFLTDRIQIWRVMRDVKSLDNNNGDNDPAANSGTTAATTSKNIEPLPDLIQDWWTQVVEPIFSTRLPSTLLSLHRSKLFTTRSSLSHSISTRLEPQPSPFAIKTRTLLSLDRSARKKTEKEERGKVAESPTLKKLMGCGSVNGGPGRMGEGRSYAGASQKDGDLEGEEVFKVPLAMIKSGRSNLGKELSMPGPPPSTTSQQQKRSSSTSRPSLRNQDNPRPHPPSSRRGDSLSSISSSGTSARNLFASSRRREVSLPLPSSSGTTVGGIGGRKRKLQSTAFSANLKGKEKELEKGEVSNSTLSQRNKRKSLSPRKIPSTTTLLVPDTPSSSSIRPVSFAALGAAWRPGGAENQGGGIGNLSFAPALGRIPPAPVLAKDWDMEDDEGVDQGTPKKNCTRGFTWEVPNT